MFECTAVNIIMLFWLLLTVFNFFAIKGAQERDVFGRLPEAVNAALPCSFFTNFYLLPTAYSYNDADG